MKIIKNVNKMYKFQFFERNLHEKKGNRHFFLNIYIGGILSTALEMSVDVYVKNQIYSFNG